MEELYNSKQMSYKVGVWFILVPGACGIAPKGMRTLTWQLALVICSKELNMHEDSQYAYTYS